MKRLLTKNRSVIATLLVGWLLLCGAMPLLAVDMTMDASMGEMAGSQHHSASAMCDEPISGGADQHCCDAMTDSAFMAQNQFADFLASLWLVAAVCSFLFLWIKTTRKTNTYYYSFVPVSGPPLHQRLCVWLD